jgi:hypothetical protein
VHGRKPKRSRRVWAIMLKFRRHYERLMKIVTWKVSGQMKKEKKGNPVLDYLKYIMNERNDIKPNRQNRNRLENRLSM